MCKNLAFKGAQSNRSALFFQKASSFTASSASYFHLGIEAFSGVLSGDRTGILGPLWQRGPPNWEVWSAADAALVGFFSDSQFHNSFATIGRDDVYFTSLL